MLKPSKKSGFTLIELLVVISIIVILAGLLLPQLMGSAARAREGAARAEIVQLEVTLTRYYSDCGAYPESESDFSSRALVNALKGDLNKKRYYTFTEGRLRNGEYISPLGHLYYYRENWSVSTKTADMNNPDSFDLWTSDRKGSADGLNNWGGGGGAPAGSGSGTTEEELPPEP